MRRADADNQQPTASFVTQWLEVLRRDVNHPSIIGWCPLNETHQALHDRITQLDDVTRGDVPGHQAGRSDPAGARRLAATRHRVAETDVWDCHDYEQDPAAVRRQPWPGWPTGDPYGNRHRRATISLPYAGQPYFVSEFGGIWWNPDAPTPTAGRPDRVLGLRRAGRATRRSSTPASPGLTDVLLDDPRMFGYCYTQLTDVFQEENGIYRFDRRPKLDVDRIRAIQTRAAAYEISGPPAG